MRSFLLVSIENSIMAIDQTTSVTVDFTPGAGSEVTITVSLDNYNSGSPVVHYLNDADIVDTKDYIISALIAKHEQTDYTTAKNS